MIMIMKSIIIYAARALVTLAPLISTRCLNALPSDAGERRGGRL